MGIVMKGATPNEKQLEKNKNDPHKSKEQTAKGSRDNIHQTKKSWKRARMICEHYESRSHNPTGSTQNSSWQTRMVCQTLRGTL